MQYVKAPMSSCPSDAANTKARLEGPADIFTIPKRVLTTSEPIATVDCSKAIISSSVHHD